MLNTRLFNIHDFIIIGAIVIITHILFQPVYDKINGKVQTAD